MGLFSQGNTPGFTSAIETEESQVYKSGRNGQTMIVDSPAVLIDDAVVDAGNTPTTTLRGGNLMAIKASDSKAYLYDPDATDGTQLPVGVLESTISMLQNGVAADRFVSLLQGGILKESELLNDDAQALAVLLRIGFRLDSMTPNGAAFLIHPRKVQSHATDYTVVAADNGDLLVATAAANFTLPTKAVGLSFEFLQTADANMVITGSSDIVVDGGATRSTITFSTASHKIGSRVRLLCIYIGGSLKWVVENLGSTTMTLA